jgi:tRNA(Ile)-lysidine synthase
MLRSFLHYFEQEKIDIDTANILCAVSGGKDSMVMLHLFLNAKIKVGVAHINHKTRGSENDEDYLLIKTFCEDHNLPLYYYELDPEIATSSNFQAIASAERYRWMMEIMTAHGYTKIATAHHKDDNVESFVMNLLRGSGLKGLSGIAPVKNDVIIRPLYHLTRKQIDHYQLKHQIPYREDSSNQKDDYLRNKIRNQLITPLKKIDEHAVDQINESIRLIAEGEQLLQYYITEDRELSFNTPAGLVINLDRVVSRPSPHTILWYLLNSLGFNKYDIHDILNSERSGAEFYTKTHKAILNRNQLHVRSLESANTESVSMEIKGNGEYQVNSQIKIKLELVEILDLTKDANIEFLGFKSFPYPLTVRNKVSGDIFKPIGLKGKSKKLKDFITDQKLNPEQKSNLLILDKDSEIVYVMPHRISENYKVNKDSKYIVKVSYMAK